jgi:NADPH-dependent ferric siderophore reductase
MFFDHPNPPVPHDAIRVLFAGDATSVPAIREMLAVLPICARGQVFVEVGSSDEVVELASPGRVTVTWLARDRRSGAPGSGLSCAPGEALGRAVRAWLGEMYVDPEALATAEHLIWLGGSESFAYDLRHDLRAAAAVEHGASAV